MASQNKNINQNSNLGHKHLQFLQNLLSFFCQVIQRPVLDAVVPVLEMREMFSSSLSPRFSYKTHIQSILNGPLGCPFCLLIWHLRSRIFLVTKNKLASEQKLSSHTPVYGLLRLDENFWRVLMKEEKSRLYWIVVQPLCFTVLSHFRAK